MIGHKHLLTCRCVLQQFSQQKNPPLHKFIVFSIMNDEDKVVPSFAQCNNCGNIHKIIDICQSEIMNRDESRALQTIEDIKVNLPDKIVSLLDKYNVDLPTWQHVEFALNNEKWGEVIFLSSDDIDGTIQGKVLILLGSTLFKIESFTKETLI